MKNVLPGSPLAASMVPNRLGLSYVSSVLGAPYEFIAKFGNRLELSMLTIVTLSRRHIRAQGSAIAHGTKGALDHSILLWVTIWFLQLSRCLSTSPIGTRRLNNL
jgi:hypothetical protein